MEGNMNQHNAVTPLAPTSSMLTLKQLKHRLHHFVSETSGRHPERIAEAIDLISIELNNACEMISELKRRRKFSKTNQNNTIVLYEREIRKMLNNILNDRWKASRKNDNGEYEIYTDYGYKVSNQDKFWNISYMADGLIIIKNMMKKELEK